MGCQYTYDRAKMCGTQIGTWILSHSSVFYVAFFLRLFVIQPWYDLIPELVPTEGSNVGIQKSMEQHRGDHLQIYETWQSTEEICHLQLPPAMEKIRKTPRKPRDLEIFFPWHFTAPHFCR